MKRFFFFTFVIFLFGALLSVEIGGLLLKAIAHFKLGSRLAYREMSLGKKGLVLEDAILFDISGGKSAFFLRSEKIQIDWNWPLHFSLQIHQPHVTLSKEILRAPSSQEGRFISFSLQIEEGLLEWSGGEMKPVHFSLQKDADGLDAKFYTEEGLFSICEQLKTCSVAWHNLSSDWILGLARLFKIDIPAFSAAEGLWNGNAELSHANEGYDLQMRMEGKEFLFAEEKIRWGGSVEFDWKWKGKELCNWVQGTERLRYSMQNGVFAVGSSEIQQIQYLATFQAGLGMKWEGSAEVGHLPFSTEGKSFFSDPFWLEGECRLGKMVGHIFWKEGRWYFGVEQGGPREIGVLAAFAPKIGEWSSESVSGAISLSNFQDVRIEHFHAEQITFHAEKMQGKCEMLDCHDHRWEIIGLSLSPVGFSGNGHWDPLTKCLQLQGSWKNSEVSAQIGADFLEGKIGNSFWKGAWDWEEGSTLKISIPTFAGDIPAPFFEDYFGLKAEGHISALDEGLSIKIHCKDRIEVEDWSLRCRLSKAKAVLLDTFSVSEAECVVFVDPTKLDCSAAKGILLSQAANRSIVFPIAVPSFVFTKEGCSFDVRMLGEKWDILRIVGIQKENKLWFDEQKTHLFGAPLRFGPETSFGQGSLEVAFDWKLVEGVLREKDLLGTLDWDLDGKICCKGEWGERTRVEFVGEDWKWNGVFSPFSGKIEKTEKGWNLTSFCFGSLIGKCDLLVEQTHLQLEHGEAQYRGLEFDFDGKILVGPRFDIAIQHVSAMDLTYFFPKLQGRIEGQGRFAFDGKEAAIDLDLMTKELTLDDFSLENKGSLHVFGSSKTNILVQGMDLRISKGTLEGHAALEILEVDWKQKKMVGQEANVQLPSDWFSWLDSMQRIDLTGNFESVWDRSKIACSIAQGSIPIGEANRQIKDLQLVLTRELLQVETSFLHFGKWGILKLAADLENGQGTFSVKGADQVEEPLSIQWTYTKPEGLFIRSCEGSFAGVTASFRIAEKKEFASELLGSAKIHFARLSEWIPPEVSEAFRDLEMGGGYVLMGHLTLGAKDLANMAFHGLFCGHGIELLGYEFRTLLSKADLSPTSLQLSDIKVSDRSGILKIDELVVQKQGTTPWTIHLPHILVSDLRPGLLRKPGEGEQALTPLLVRELKMTDFHGILDNGKTYRANGELTFINSYKREKTLLDLPANVFGRIIGLDLELLIPVKGNLTFELKDGFYQLTELKEAYSEGGRSEFFLVADPPPRMSIRGDLKILVQMKQYVLFALTEAFLISVDGKLSNPQWGLQKKKRWWLF